MSVTIAKEFRFEAAHSLRHHQGKCKRLHGHSYRVRVVVGGELHLVDGRQESGMVMDFGRITDAWKDIEPLLDHQVLNETLDIYPTAELLAVYLLEAFRLRLRLDSSHCTVKEVTVWETETSSATAT